MARGTNMGAGRRAFEEAGIEPLEFDYHGFSTNSYLVRSRDKMVLVDAGSAAAARDVILPRLSKAGRRSLIAVVDTHSHADHSGGTALLASRTGRRAMIHSTEVKWIADRRLAFRDWFELWKHDVPVTRFMKDEFLADTGDGFGDPIPVEGGESLEAASMSLIHTPGHSPGSISVFAEEGRCLFTGDSVQGAGTAPYESTIPLYDDYSTYRSSLLKLGRMKADVVLSGHPLKPFGKARFVGEEVKELISVSLRTADQLHAEVRGLVRDREGGSTTLEAAQETAKAHGSTWLQPVGTFFVRTLAAHLRQLEAEGAVKRDRGLYFAKS